MQDRHLKRPCTLGGQLGGLAPLATYLPGPLSNGNGYPERSGLASVFANSCSLRTTTLRSPAGGYSTSPQQPSAARLTGSPSPRYEKLVGDLAGCYSRRINTQHRLVYEVFPDRHVVHVPRMWTHYE